MPNLDRVVVTGTSCSGKTTFARELAGILGSPHVELDALFWGPQWARRSDFAEQVAAAAVRPTWVADGNYSAIRDILWPRATTIVWLNYSFPLTFGRALRRTTRRLITREPLFADNRETLRGVFLDPDGILWWVLKTYRRRRREMPLLMQRPEFSHIEFLVFHEPAQAATFLHHLSAVS